jgi:hypothetical protein
MLLLVLLIIFLVLFFAVGFAVHLLWILAAIFFVALIVDLFQRRR